MFGKLAKRNIWQSLLIAALFAFLILSVPWIFGQSNSIGLQSSTFKDVMLSFGGAILGATLGAFASRNLWFEQQNELERVNAYSLMLKIQQATSDLLSVQKSFKLSISESEKILPKSVKLWQRMQPLAGVPRRVDHQPSDLLVFFRAKDYSLLEDTILLFARHESTMDHVRVFNRLREEIRNLMPNAFELISGSGALKTILTPEQASALMPREVELESLATQIMENIEEDVELGNRLVSKIGPVCGRVFNDNSFPQLIIPATTTPKTDENLG
jgi:hypothetical protein